MFRYKNSEMCVFGIERKMEDSIEQISKKVLYGMLEMALYTDSPHKNVNLYMKNIELLYRAAILDIYTDSI